MKNFLFIALAFAAVAFTNCKKEGCTKKSALNYDADAKKDDGSCIEKVLGCTDPTSFNYNPQANVSDGSCIPKVFGCTDGSATNYNPAANVDDGSCQYQQYGSVIFYYNTMGTDATVIVNGEVDYITDYWVTTPNCGAFSCANFNLPVGTYYYSASSTWSDWNGYVTVTNNGCTKVLLD